MAVRVAGGIADEQTLSFSLVRGHGGWRIAAVHGYQPRTDAIASAISKYVPILERAGLDEGAIACVKERAGKLMALTNVDGLRGGGNFTDPISRVIQRCRSESS